jgi:valyl-tRNA synthetase
LLLSYAAGSEPELRPRELEEHWILARLDAAREQVDDALGSFEFFRAVDALYHVTFDDFCDWYLEAIKPRLRDGDEDARATALAALERLLALLHPVMPHVTEEIWSNLPARKSRLIVSPWPPRSDPAAVTPGSDLVSLERVQDAARIFRRSGVQVRLEGDEHRIFEAVVRPERTKANGNAAVEIERLRGEVQRAEKMLANERFVSNAPAEKVEEERDKLARYRRELDALESTLA